MRDPVGKLWALLIFLATLGMAALAATCSRFLYGSK